ncbi:hypothetical protein HK098_004305 [Nowakowskiella sp. JEL0407]|nr:hypothetical protein HK098_004305 [Nowakowskiella sp. JEL0407]
MLWSMVAISALGTATMALVDPLTKPPLPQQPNIPNSKKLLKSPAPQRVLSKTQSLLEILSSQHSITVPDPPTKKTTMGRLREIKNVASERSTLLLVMFLFNQGLNCAYSFTVLTAYVPDAWDSSRKSSLLAEIFLSIGVASIIFSFLTGILYDKFGWKPLIAINLLGTIMCIAQLIIGFDLNLWGSTPPLEFLIANLVIGGFVLSASSTASNSLINIALSAYGERSPGAFGVYRVLFCLGMVIGSLIFRFLNRTVCSVINLVILLGGCWMYTINKAENEAKSKNSQTNTNAPAVKLEKEPSFVIKSSMIKKSSAFESEMV